MKSSDKNNFDKMLKKWKKEVSLSQALTNSDIDELESHLMDIYDDLRKLGLNEEESFLVANSRLGNPINWESEFLQTNKIELNLKKIITFLGGVLFYFFSYYMIVMISKGIFIASKIFNTDTTTAITNSRLFLLFAALLGLLLIISILIEDDYFFRIIDKIKIKPLYTYLLFIFTVSLAIGNHYIMFYINKLANDAKQCTFLKELFRYFDYIFFSLIILGFIILYTKFIKKGNAPK